MVTEMNNRWCDRPSVWTTMIWLCFKSWPDWTQTLMSPGSCSVISDLRDPLNGTSAGGEGVDLRGVHGNGNSWGSQSRAWLLWLCRPGRPALVCALHIPCQPHVLSLLFPPSAELVFLLPLAPPITSSPHCPLYKVSIILHPSYNEQGSWFSHQLLTTSWATYLLFVCFFFCKNIIWSGHLQNICTPMEFLSEESQFWRSV